MSEQINPSYEEPEFYENNEDCVESFDQMNKNIFSEV
jgi:hypothetical protein